MPPYQSWRAGWRAPRMNAEGRRPGRGIRTRSSTSGRCMEQIRGGGSSPSCATRSTIGSDATRRRKSCWTWDDDTIEWPPSDQAADDPQQSASGSAETGHRPSRMPWPVIAAAIFAEVPRAARTGSYVRTRKSPGSPTIPSAPVHGPGSRRGGAQSHGGRSPFPAGYKSAEQLAGERNDELR
jgi:hypothetical protein